MVSRSLGALTIDLILKAGGFTTGMDKAARNTRNKSYQMKKDLQDLAKAAAAFAVAGVAAGSALIESSIDVADQAAKTADKLGLTTEELSKLRYAGEQTGVSQNTMDMALQRMTRRLAEAKEGLGEAKGAINELGLDAKQLADSGPDEAFKTIAESLSQIPDQATRVRLAFKFFDSEGVALVNTMAQGRNGIESMGDELERLGGVIDTKTAKQAEAFNANIERMQQVVRGTGNDLATELLPSLVEFTDLIQEPETQEAIKSIVTGIANMGVSAATATVELVNFGNWLGKTLADVQFGIASNDIAGMVTELERLNEMKESTFIDRIVLFGRDGLVEFYDDAELDAEIAKIQEGIKSARERLAPSALVHPNEFIGPELPKPEIDTEQNKAILAYQEEQKKLQAQLDKDFASRIGRYNEQLELVGEITELERLRYDLRTGAMDGLNAEQEMHLESLAIQLDQLRVSQELAQSEAERIDLFTGIEDTMERQIALYGEVTEADRVRFETSFGSLSLLNEAEKLRLMTLADELDALNEAAEADLKRTEQIKSSMEKIEEFGKEAARNVQNNLADFLFDPFEDGLKGMLTGFTTTIRKMAAEVASQAALKSLFGGLAGSANPYLAAFGGLFDAGGTLGSNQWGIVGELGPEIVRGPAVITGRQETARMMGGSGVDVNIINNASVSVTRGPTRTEGGRVQQDIIIEAMRGAISEGAVDDVMGQTYGVKRSGGQG